MNRLLQSLEGPVPPVPPRRKGDGRIDGSRDRWRPRAPARRRPGPGVGGFDGRGSLALLGATRGVSVGPGRGPPPGDEVRYDWARDTGNRTIDGVLVFSWNGTEVRQTRIGVERNLAVVEGGSFGTRTGTSGCPSSLPPSTGPRIRPRYPCDRSLLRHPPGDRGRELGVRVRPALLPRLRRAGRAVSGASPRAGSGRGQARGRQPPHALSGPLGAGCGGLRRPTLPAWDRQAPQPDGGRQPGHPQPRGPAGGSAGLVSPPGPPVR